MVLRARLADSAAWHAACVPSDEPFRLRDDGIYAGRGATRFYLAQILGCRLDEVPLQRRSHDTKPTLCGSALPARWRGLALSRTRAGAYAWAALSLGTELGLDLEPWPSTRFDDLDALVDMLPPALANEVQQAPPSQQQRRAVEGWTRYEASVKLSGEGIALFPTDLPEHVRTRTFVLESGFVGSIASTKQIDEVVVVELSPPSFAP